MEKVSAATVTPRDTIVIIDDTLDNSPVATLKRKSKRQEPLIPKKRRTKAPSKKIVPTYLEEVNHNATAKQQVPSSFQDLDTKQGAMANRSIAIGFQDRNTTDNSPVKQNIPAGVLDFYDNSNSSSSDLPPEVSSTKGCIEKVNMIKELRGNPYIFVRTPTVSVYPEGIQELHEFIVDEGDYAVEKVSLHYHLIFKFLKYSC
jgi:hypothetical protein